MIGIVAFSNGGLIVQQPTNDQATLVFSTIDRLTPRGGTSLGHGIFTSLNAIAGEALAIDETSLEEGAPALKIDNSSSLRSSSCLQMVRIQMHPRSIGNRSVGCRIRGANLPGWCWQPGRDSY